MTNLVDSLCGYRDVRRRAAGTLLRASVLPDERPPDDEARRLLHEASTEIVLELAVYHGVAGWLHEWLCDIRGVPAALLGALDVERTDAVEWHMRGLWQLDRLRTTLDGANVRWVVVKGPVLVDMLHGSIERRTYFDLDVLVDPADFRVALGALAASGARLLDRNWRGLRRDMRGQVHLALPGGIPLDLHWDLVNVHRRRMAMDTSALLERRTIVDLGGVAVPTLDPVDSVIHLAVHAASSGGDKLMWLKDLERAVAVRPPAWGPLVERARAWHVAGAVGLMLDRSRRVLAADVPASVPARLAPRRLLQLARAVDRRSPPERSRGGPTAGRILARVSGYGVVDGSVVAGHRLIRHLDPREPLRSSPFVAAGDAADREAFLEAVASSVGRRS